LHIDRQNCAARHRAVAYIGKTKMTSKSVLGLLLAGAAAVASPAWAQLSRPPPDEATPASTGPLAGFAPFLTDHGINLRSVLTDEFAANPVGGVRQGNDNVGQIYLGADFDLGKIAGITGGSFHVTVYNDYGRSLGKDYTGVFIKQQEDYKNAFPKVHLGLVSYEQKLLDNKLDIIVGHLGSTAYFGHTQPGCAFQAGTSCGIPAVLNSEAGFTLLPSATWGSNIKYRTSAHTYVDFGAFEVNPFVAHTNGLNFNTEHATGFTAPIEFGYENNDLNQVAYPSEFKVGYYSGTGTRPDVFYNTKGQSLGLFGGTARNATGLRQGAWIMGDKTVWRPDPLGTENLLLFGGYVQPFENEEIVDREVYVGALLRGAIHSRPDDTIGWETGWFHISPGEAGFLRDSLIKAGGVGDARANEFVNELNYGIQVNHAIRLTPNLQYVINPDNSQIPKIDFVPKNMLVVGIKLVVNMADLFGLPSKPLND
jgi:porin